MDINFKIALITITSSILGILIGWILKELSSRRDINFKNKKQYKKVLFSLLRIRNYVIFSNSEDIKDSIAETYSKNLPDTENLKAKEF